jgi:NADPH:quinone reductase-like Zn-dependent oxidoreductase
MTETNQATGLELRSLIRKSGELELSLTQVTRQAPADDQVLVRVEATPINPSDLGLLLGPADMATARATGGSDGVLVTAKVPAAALPSLAARLDQPMPVGNEGAGTVIAAGASEAAQALKGKTVSMIGGGMYTQYRLLKATDCQALPAGTTAAEGASWFVNPLTALGMTETMKREGHKALVHTAAASNLGQMLVRICLEDRIPLVNIVRSAQQAKLLRDLGAKHVCDSTAPGFAEELTAALAETGATIAFDATGGGKLASQILTCMEAALSRGAGFSRYGSSVHKQVYIYGSLNTGPTELVRAYGMAWGVGGWLLTPFLQKIGRPDQTRLRQRVAAGLKTTFASRYTKVVSLREAFQLDNIAAYAKRATGEKFLINPNK